MKETYLAVAGRIRLETQVLSRSADRAREIWKQGSSSGVDFYVDAVALNLYAFYAGLERIFRVIADGVDRTRLPGAEGGQNLLRQMAVEIQSVRPPVISEELCEKLDRYRGFHHVLREVYTFGYDPEGVGLLVKSLPETVDLAVQDLSTFADFLERLVNDA